MEDLKWYSVDDAGFQLDGLYWRKKGGVFRRIPEKAFVSERVNALADSMAGVMLRFRSDTAMIAIKVKLKIWIESFSSKMPSVATTGFDLYIGSGKAKTFFGASTKKRDASEYQTVMFGPVQNRKMREFTLNFPLWSGIEEFQIGLSPDAKILPPTPWPDPRPVAVYGTSIQQGGCASRPGIAHTNQMSRLLDRPFLNFGFSGSGLGEEEIARVLAGIRDPAMYVLDYDANAGVKGLKKTLSRFIDILREKHPETPILLVSRLPMANEWHDPFEYTQTRQELTEIHLGEIARRRAQNDRNIHFLDGTTLYGPEPSECSVDGIHATDLGFFFISRTMAPVIERILTQGK